MHLNNGLKFTHNRQLWNLPVFVTHLCILYIFCYNYIQESNNTVFKRNNSISTRTSKFPSKTTTTKHYYHNAISRAEMKTSANIWRWKCFVENIELQSNSKCTRIRHKPYQQIAWVLGLAILQWLIWHYKWHSQLSVTLLQSRVLLLPWLH